MFPLVSPELLKLLVPIASQCSAWRASTGQPVSWLNRIMVQTAETHPPIG